MNHTPARTCRRCASRISSNWYFSICFVSICIHILICLWVTCHAGPAIDLPAGCRLIVFCICICICITCVCIHIFNYIQITCCARAAVDLYFIFSFVLHVFVFTISLFKSHAVQGRQDVYWWRGGRYCGLCICTFVSYIYFIYICLYLNHKPGSWLAGRMSSTDEEEAATVASQSAASFHLHDHAPDLPWYFHFVFVFVYTNCSYFDVFDYHFWHWYLYCPPDWGSGFISPENALWVLPTNRVLPRLFSKYTKDIGVNFSQLC